MEEKTTNNKIITSVDNLLKLRDMKVKKLVDILLKRKIISEAESKEIFTMEPFAQVSL